MCCPNQSFLLVGSAFLGSLEDPSAGWELLGSYHWAAEPVAPFGRHQCEESKSTHPPRHRRCGGHGRLVDCGFFGTNRILSGVYQAYDIFLVLKYTLDGKIGWMGSSIVLQTPLWNSRQTAMQMSLKSLIFSFIVNSATAGRDVIPFTHLQVVLWCNGHSTYGI